MGKRLKGAGWGIIVTLVVMGGIGIVGGAIVGGFWLTVQAGKRGGDVCAFAAVAVVLLLIGAVWGAISVWGDD